MIEKDKLKLKQLKVQSFVTVQNDQEEQNLRGGWNSLPLWNCFTALLDNCTPTVENC